MLHPIKFLLRKNRLIYKKIYQKYHKSDWPLYNSQLATYVKMFVTFIM